MKRRAFLIAGATGTTALVLGGGWAGYAHSTYSEGWRMGRLDKLSLRSSWRRAYVKSTGEGELLLGNSSAVAQWTGADGQQATNPWFFSCPPEDYERFRPLIGRVVAVRYRQLQSPWTAWGGDTDYRAEEIEPVSGDPVGPCSAVAGGLRSSGERQGRIVKLTRKGRLFTSHEATVQVGDSGNRFIEMSVPNDAMAQCAAAYVRSGRSVVVGYSETLVRNPLARDTNYIITELRGFEEPPR